MWSAISRGTLNALTACSQVRTIDEEDDLRFKDSEEVPQLIFKGVVRPRQHMHSFTAVESALCFGFIAVCVYIYVYLCVYVCISWLHVRTYIHTCEKLCVYLCAVVSCMGKSAQTLNVAHMS